MNKEQNPLKTPIQREESDDRRLLYRAGTVFILILSFFLVIQSLNSIIEYQYIGSDIDPQATIRVRGEGEIFAVPDTASFRATVIEEAESANVAQEAAAERMTRAIEKIKEFGVAEEDIKTIHFRSNPRYEYQRRVGIPRPPSSERTLVGFEVRHSIQVKVEERDTAGEIIAALGGIGVQEISNVEMTIDDPQQLQVDAREKAITDAKTNATQLANDLGVSLVRIISFDESGNTPQPYFLESADAGRGGQGGNTPTPLSEGEQQIISNVTIVYEIR